MPRLSEPVRDECDVTEVNHFYDPEGRLVFDQIIWWDYRPNYQEVVRAWRLVKSPDMIPQSDHARGGFVTVWQDSGAGGDVLRIVRSQSFRETFTQVDVELENREVAPTEKRRGLSRRMR